MSERDLEINLMQEKLMDAKVDQLLHHRGELHLEETLPNSQVSLENVVSTVQTLIITSFLS